MPMSMDGCRRSVAGYGYGFVSSSKDEDDNMCRNNNVRSLMHPYNKG